MDKGRACLETERPEDALAPLVPTVDRLKMPSFPNCFKVSDWTEGGGYAAAVQAYNRMVNMLRKFSGDLQQVHFIEVRPEADIPHDLRR